MTELTAEKLAELKRLNEAAMPPPWTTHREGEGPSPAVGWDLGRFYNWLIGSGPGVSARKAEESVEADAKLTVAMRNTLPALIKAAEERDRLERLFVGPLLDDDTDRDDETLEFWRSDYQHAYKARRPGAACSPRACRGGEAVRPRWSI